jgi:hypothetical protein
VLTTRARRFGAAAGALILALLLVVGLYIALRKVAAPLLPTGTGCTAKAHGQGIPLADSQAAIAATIAGVAQHRSLPRRAVTVAYATALQESKLQNLYYGDRDSVGVFQQRPSQGWGPAKRLEDPIYATRKFFAALTAVRGYRIMPVYQAAQAVQHSADGYAYGQYSTPAAILATAFTGRAAHAVWCWYGSGITGRARMTAAARQLRRTFGRQDLRTASDPGLMVRISGERAGWAEAAWLVTHAASYGIREIRYAGLQWTAQRGTDGWVRTRSGGQAHPPPGTIVLG